MTRRRDIIIEQYRAVRIWPLVLIDFLILAALLAIIGLLLYGGWAVAHYLTEMKGTL